MNLHLVTQVTDMAIQDLESAAVAVMNAKVSYDTAMKMLLETDKALSNSSLQMRAAKHVGGRTFFLGTSQHKYMEPENGDVLRNKDDNFFPCGISKERDMIERGVKLQQIYQRFQSVVQPTIPKTSIDSLLFSVEQKCLILLLVMIEQHILRVQEQS